LSIEADTKPEHNEIDFRENERQLVLSQLREVMDYLHNRMMKGQSRKPEIDRVKVGYAKAFCHAATVYNQITKDVEIDDLQKELDKIKLLLKK
jgi:hypothetical protein